jgi:acyl-CoA hydrolase
MVYQNQTGNTSMQVVLHVHSNKMENRKYHTVRIIPKSNIKIVERQNVYPKHVNT